MNIVTCGDTAFFPFLKRLERNLASFPGHSLTIYDLGLTGQDRAGLASPVHATPFPDDTFAMDSRRNIKTNHKPACIRDFMRRSGQDCLYLDADILLTEPLDGDPSLLAADLTVTGRHPREQRPHILVNGRLNAGVIGFRCNDRTLAFLDDWEEACRRPDTTDQMALSALLESLGIDWSLTVAPQSLAGLTVAVLDAETYNDVTCRTGKVFHFKSAARRRPKFLTYRLFAALQVLFPGLVRRLVGLNRKKRFWVWRQKPGA